MKKPKSMQHSTVSPGESGGEVQNKSVRHAAAAAQNRRQGGFAKQQTRAKRGRFSRGFILLLLGQAASLMGNYTLRFALSMYVLEQTGSAGVFGGLLALSVLPTILLTPFGGILADRVSRQRLMVALDTLSGLAVLAAGLALGRGLGLWAVGGLLVALSVLGAFESPTVQACVPQMLGQKQLMAGNAAVGQIQAVCSLVTPFLGSALYAAFGLGPVVFGAAGCFFVTAGLECFIRLKPPTPAPAGGVLAVLKKDFAAGARFLGREKPDILKLLLLAALINLFMAGVTTVGFPYLVRTALGLPAQYYGAAESLLGAGAIIGGALAGMAGQKLQNRRLADILAAAGGCLVLIGLVFLLPLGRLGQYAVLVGALFCCQTGCTVFSICALAAIQACTPQQLMGRVMACVYTLSLCAQPLGQLLYGALFDWFSAAAGWVLLPTGLAVCAAGLCCRRFLQKFLQRLPG